MGATTRGAALTSLHPFPHLSEDAEPGALPCPHLKVILEPMKACDSVTPEAVLSSVPHNSEIPGKVVVETCSLNCHFKSVTSLLEK